MGSFDWSQFGLAGLVIGALFTLMYFAGKSILELLRAISDRQATALDKLDATLDNLRTAIQDQTVNTQRAISAQNEMWIKTLSEEGEKTRAKIDKLTDYQQRTHELLMELRGSIK